MDEPKESAKCSRKRKGRANMTIGEIKQRKAKGGITKKEFERLLKKAAQPVSEWKHDQEESGTSAVHPSDGCTETRKNQDKTEGGED